MESNSTLLSEAFSKGVPCLLSKSNIFLSQLVFGPPFATRAHQHKEKLFNREVSSREGGVGKRLAKKFLLCLNECFCLILQGVMIDSIVVKNQINAYYAVEI